MSVLEIANQVNLDIKTYNELADKARMFDAMCKNANTVFIVGMTRNGKTRTIITNQEAKAIIDKRLEEDVEEYRAMHKDYKNDYSKISVKLWECEKQLEEAKKRWYHFGSK